MEGIVFAIEEFSVYDGPGIRTTVFLKGCPLRCSWCHNPEGQEFEPVIVRIPNGCIGCNACLRSAVRRGETVVFTEESKKQCPGNLLRTCGEKFTSDRLIAKLMKNTEILKNGGITFSGGEPLSQGEFLLECLSKLKRVLPTAVQTSGFGRNDIFAAVLERADYFLYDLKLVSCELHKKYTGVPNEGILRHFTMLARSGKEFVVRIPLIPGVTDTEENITAIATLLCENGVSYAELLPYNTMAGRKYKMLMRSFAPDFNTKVPPDAHQELFLRFGIETKRL